MRSTLRRSMIELSIDGRVEKCESQPRDGDRHQDPKQLRTLMYLMQNIKSAATIVSDTSTALGVGHGRGDSEFEDHFSPERSQAMRRWISDNSILEEHSDLDFSHHQRRGRLVDKEFNYDTDCDSDTKLEEGQVYFLSLAGSSQDKLDEAQSHLMDSVRSDASNLGPLSELLSLVEALFEKEDYPNALICGRRALRAYRKTGPIVHRRTVYPPPAFLPEGSSILELNQGPQEHSPNEPTSQIFCDPSGKILYNGEDRHP
ncbi:hypothetical protein F5882DRAFT_439713 [Hyaloscypha sp. PMI_1271]|nr:hypothetical protein F5882DRAFT_439713 [Hyaloscypha sp. PMI_1271]